MPNQIMAFDNNFPTFTSTESPAQQIAALHSYLYQVREGLMYSLRNLSQENFNPNALQKMSEDQRTEMEKLLEKVYAQLNQISAEANNLAAAVSGNSAAVGELKNWATETDGSMKRILGVLVLDEEGNVRLGAEGIRLDLVGEITVNGIPFENGGNI